MTTPGVDVEWRRRGRVGVVAGRRSRRRVAAGVVLAVVCAAGAWVVTARASGRVGVLVTARPLAAGTPLGAHDVRVVHLAGAAGLGVVRAGDRDRAVGRQVALPLPAGALVTEQVLGRRAWPPAGQAVVTVTPKGGRRPAVRSGDRVAVVVLSDDTADRPDHSGEGMVEATVVDVDRARNAMAEPSEEDDVSLLVAAADAPGLAQAAADDRVALVLLAPS